MNPALRAQQSLMASGFSISRGRSIIIRPEGGKEKENGLRSEERFPFLICGGRRSVHIHAGRRNTESYLGNHSSLLLLCTLYRSVPVVGRSPFRFENPPPPFSLKKSIQKRKRRGGQSCQEPRKSFFLASLKYLRGEGKSRVVASWQ